MPRLTPAMIKARKASEAKFLREMGKKFTAQFAAEVEREELWRNRKRRNSLEGKNIDEFYSGDSHEVRMLRAGLPGTYPALAFWTEQEGMA